jgi:hypothetical protein
MQALAPDQSRSSMPCAKWTQFHPLPNELQKSRFCQDLSKCYHGNTLALQAPHGKTLKRFRFQVETVSLSWVGLAACNSFQLAEISHFWNAP